MKIKIKISISLLTFFCFSQVFSYEIDKNLEKKINFFVENISIEKEKSKVEKILVFLQKNKNFWEKWLYLHDKLREKLVEYNSKNTLQKVLIWYSETWEKIYAYYKWDKNKPFFWVFSNIHWGYEYGTYKTAMDMIDYFDKSGKKQWFIIPTINPDWLKIAQKDGFKLDYYLSWRENALWFDLNRSFCTSDFRYVEYEKKEAFFESSKICNSQSEIKAVINVLETFKFSEIISLHSEWEIFFIPDNTYYDEEILNLVRKLKNILPEYNFDYPKYNYLDRISIKDYEINEWEIENKPYTWTMENYIYGKYKIPTVLIEFEKHWLEEAKLLKIVEFLPK